MNRLLPLLLLLLCSFAYSQQNSDLEQRGKALKELEAQFDAESAQSQQHFDPELRANAIAKMKAKIDADMAHYRSYPRRLYVGKNPPLAVSIYVNPILEKIQQIGTLNYPAKTEGRLYGTALVAIQIGARGNLIEASVLKSSGEEVLDQAALKAIRLASPFAEFPSELKQRADILVVTRYFNFRRSVENAH